jgi:2-iminobutanoate/2-iminopropanoate deaminase
MQKNIIQTKDAPAAIGPYSQAVKAGNFLFISGQIPIDPSNGELISGDIETETHRVMKNLEAILKAADCDLSSVVKSTLFIKNMADFAKINSVYASYFTSEFPARETVEVAALPRSVNVEISVIAFCDEEKE